MFLPQFQAGRYELVGGDVISEDDPGVGPEQDEEHPVGDGLLGLVKLQELEVGV